MTEVEKLESGMIKRLQIQSSPLFHFQLQKYQEMKCQKYIDYKLLNQHKTKAKRSINLKIELYLTIHNFCL